MIVHGIDNLTKKDIPLYYRNEYEGVADLEFPSGDRLPVPIDFTVEMKPTGEKIINVNVKDQIDYPLIPIIRALKEEIMILENSGDLR